MEFKYKTAKELAELTPEQQDFYVEQKRAFEASENKKAIKEALEEFKKENPAEKSPITKEQWDELQETINQLKENTTTGNGGKVVKMVDEVNANKAELGKILKSADGTELVLKANTTRASISDNYHALTLSGIGQLTRIARSFYDICRKVTFSGSNNKGKVQYMDWDEETTVKAAGMVAEGGTFDESTAAFKTYNLDLKKVGDTIPVTEEFFEDEEMAAAELDMFLTNNVDSKVDNQLINGDGTGDNLTGALASISAYTATAAGIPGANLYDLITKVKNAIVKLAGNKYEPDFAAMSLTTIEKLVLAKDANDNYLFPPQHPIYGMIVEDNSIADNVMIVGDRRFMTIFEKPGVVLSRGLVGSQFKQDLITLKARKRLLFLIKNSDKSGFRKVTNVDTAIATLATTP
ncbi:MAG: phage major capsid protein [Acinetobacter sp.]|uniref:phage major capsid protein n=1 Tax=Acinetobacter sp. TaxID=472 RepID=UPI000F969022|nr:phage major capsid protein [Acinetobacter sp.]RUP42611.1 MAG: phage major capsid protein [Acinetobacter sp.]